MNETAPWGEKPPRFHRVQLYELQILDAAVRDIGRTYFLLKLFCSVLLFHSGTRDTLLATHTANYIVYSLPIKYKSFWAYRHTFRNSAKFRRRNSGDKVGLVYFWFIPSFDAPFSQTGIFFRFDGIINVVAGKWVDARGRPDDGGYRVGK